MLLVEQMAIIERHQNSPPVHAISIANDLGLKVFNVTTWSDDISGMIRKDPNRSGASGFAIFVNGRHPETRRRFTIAHEIAHYILHENLIGDGIVEDGLLRAQGLTNAVERQANAMAADILMPWSLLDIEIQRGRSIEALAALFNVSRDAMSYRVLGVSYDVAQGRSR